MYICNLGSFIANTIVTYIMFHITYQFAVLPQFFLFIRLKRHSICTRIYIYITTPFLFSKHMESPLTEVGARCYPAARSTSRADSNQRWHNFRRYLRDLKHYQTRFKCDSNERAS